MVGLLEQYKVIFGHLESIFAFSQSLGKKQKCLRLAWMNWNIIISKLEGIFSICKSFLKRVQYCIWWNKTRNVIFSRNIIFFCIFAIIFAFLPFLFLHFCIFAIFANFLFLDLPEDRRWLRRLYHVRFHWRRKILTFWEKSGNCLLCSRNSRAVQFTVSRFKVAIMTQLNLFRWF